MLDRLFLPVLGLLALAAITLALVWPQGLGARSPAPFGSTPVQQRPEAQAAKRRQAEASEKRLSEARDTVRTLQSQAIAPGQ